MIKRLLLLFMSHRTNSKQYILESRLGMIYEYIGTTPTIIVLPKRSFFERNMM